MSRNYTAIFWLISIYDALDKIAVNISKIRFGYNKSNGAIANVIISWTIDIMIYTAVFRTGSESSKIQFIEANTSTGVEKYVWELK